MGMPADAITTTVDVRDQLDLKRQAMAAHASQIGETSFFLAMPREAFDAAWGQEWYILQGAEPGTTEDDLFAGLPA
jgi:LmbE family N-acetylglucosaminyl deacetylase